MPTKNHTYKNEFSPAQVAAGLDQKPAEKTELDRLRERISLLCTEGTIGPITLAKVLDVRPQHIYNALRRGAIPCERNAESKLRIKEADALAYVEKYLPRRHYV